MLVTVMNVSLMRKIYVNRKDEDTTIPFVSRIDEFLKEANRTCRFHELWVLSFPYTMVELPSKVIETFRMFLTNPKLPVSLRGLLNLDCANLFEKQGRIDDFQEYLERADVAFKECNNSLARSQIKMRRLARGFVASPNVLKDLIDTSNELLRENFARAFLKIAPFTLELIFKTGNTDAMVNLHEVFHNVGKQVGLSHLVRPLDLQLLAQLNADGGHAGKVLELGASLYRDFLDRRHWTLACTCGVVMALAHDKLNNLEDSQRYADEVYDVCKREHLQMESNVAYSRAFILSNNARTRGTSPDHEFRDIESWLSGYIKDDLEYGQALLACEKICLIAGLQFEIARLAGYESTQYHNYCGRARNAIKEVRVQSQNLPLNERVRINGNCDDIEVTQLIFEAERSRTNENETQAERMYDNLISAYEIQGLVAETAIKYMQRGLCKLTRLRKDPITQKDIPLIISLEKDFRTATDMFQALRLRRLVLTSHHQMTKVHITAREWFPNTFPSDFVSDSLDSLESTVDWLRRELSAIGGLNALLQKQKFASNPEVINLYSWAIMLSIIDRRWDNLWLWSQKRKARSLSDMLGIGVIIPASIRKRIAEDQNAASLFDKYMALTTSLNTIPENERSYARQHIEEADAEMHKIPILNEYITLRDGKVEGITQLSRLKNFDAHLGKTRDIIFVDYAVYRDDFYVTTAKASAPKETCQCHILPIAVSSVRQWIRENFDTPQQRRECLQRDNYRDPTKPLRGLDPLVSPLEKASEPGDLIVMSITSVISTIPLHVLKIKDSSIDRNVPLIQRNPVVYAPSLPILEFCISRSSEEPKGRSKDQRLFFGVLEDAPSESQRVQKMFQSLARMTGDRVVCGSSATKEVFRTVIKEARQIHFHGHCVFEADNPLRQALVFAAPQSETPQSESTRTDETELLQSHYDLETAGPKQSVEAENTYLDPTTQGHTSQHPGTPKHPTTQTPTSLLSPTLSFQVCVPDDPNVLLAAQLSASNTLTQLTTFELFSTSLSSHLVVLIACDSASQTLSSASDEPLGLITGLLNAGAASVIGASWPIPSRVGRVFAERFWGGAAFGGGIRGEGKRVGEEGWIDIAVGMQQAVLKVMDDEDEGLGETYCWGAFCLYGSWGFQESN
jgi:CHAT domain-containing protein/intracellular sulfur oxidation DsrE/DsrF family protein